MTVQIMYGDSLYKYGNTNRLYGVPVSPNTNFLWSIEIDWDNDGVFDGYNEARYCVALETDRGLPDLFDGGDDGEAVWGAPPMVGTCTMKFKNDTGRFSAWSVAAGSLGLDVAPGRKVRVKVRKGYTGTEYYVFTGVTKNITEDYIAKTVVLDCVDMVEYLQEKDVIIPLNTSLPNQYTLTSAAQEILNQIDYPFSISFPMPGGYDPIDVPYYSASGNALKALLKLARAQIGYVLFVAADGTLKINLMEGSTGSTRYDYTADDLLKTIELSQPWQNIKTDVKLHIKSMTAGTSQTIWDQGVVPTQLGASSSVEIFVDYRIDGVDFVAVAAALTTPANYVANTLSDGTDTDKSANISIALSDFGTRAKLTITNNYAGEVYLTTFKVTGVPYFQNKITKSYDITDYLGVGEKTITTDQILILSNGTLGSYTPVNSLLVQYLVQTFGYPHTTKRVTVYLQSRSEQFERDVNDFVAFLVDTPDLQPVAAPDLGAGSNCEYNTFRIARIKHKWLNNNGQDIQTTWICNHALMLYQPIA